MEQKNLSISGVQKMVTPAELSKQLEIPLRTIQNAIERIFPGRMKNGVATKLTEADASMVIAEVKKSHNTKLASSGKVITSDLEMIQKAKDFALWAISKIEEQAAENAMLAPKAKVYDQIADSHGTKPLQELAKILGIGPKTIFATLRGLQILYVDNGKNLPHQRYIDSGYFIVKEEPYVAGGVSFVHPRIFVTAKGELWLAKKLGETE